MAETVRLADQIRRAFAGEAWHGDSVLEILKGVDARTAAAHPIPGAHSIWELLLHIAAWDDVILRRANGAAVELSEAENFPAVTDASESVLVFSLIGPPSFPAKNGSTPCPSMCVQEKSPASPITQLVANW